MCMRVCVHVCMCDESVSVTSSMNNLRVALSSIITITEDGIGPICSCNAKDSCEQDLLNQ